MPSFPDTRYSLVARVHDPADVQAWREFVAIYRPAIYRLARLKGLQPADADDLTQRVFMAVSRAIGDWQPDTSRGRFRSWLATIVRNAAINALTRRPIDSATGGTSVLELLHEQPESDDSLQAELNLESRRAVFRIAAGRIRAEVSEPCWQAFALTAVEGLSVNVAASRLGKTVGAIYAARARVMHRMRQEIERHELVMSEGVES